MTNKWEKKWIWIAIICGTGVLLYIYKNDVAGLFSTISNGSIDDVGALIRSWGVFAPLFSIFLMVLQAVAFPLPSFWVTLANGMVFGIFWGAFISWIGAMAGALTAFFLARILGESFVRKRYKNESAWHKVDQIGGKYGFRVVLIARLLPFVSFDFISYGAGLSRMRVGAFLLSTGIGMLPATILYSTAGNEISNLSTYNNKVMYISMALIGVLVTAYMIKAIIKKKKNS